MLMRFVCKGSCALFWHTLRPETGREISRSDQNRQLSWLSVRASGRGVPIEDTQSHNMALESLRERLKGLGDANVLRISPLVQIELFTFDGIHPCAHDARSLGARQVLFGS